MHNKTDIGSLVRLYGSQRISITSVENARELGGYAVHDNMAIKRGMLLRTASLSSISDKDVEILREKYHLTLCIDLRSNHETARHTAPRLDGIRYVNIPIIDQEAIEKKMISSCGKIKQLYDEFDPIAQILWAEKLVRSGFYENLYCYYVENVFGQKGLSQVFHEIASAESGSVLWFCQEGKDRTGIVAALLLSILGADDDTILADFELSNLFYRPLISQFERVIRIMSYPTDIENLIVATFAGVHCVSLERLWQYMVYYWGSPMDFIQGPLAVSQNDMDRIKDKYLIERLEP